MSKSRIIVLSVTQQGLTKAEVARKYGVSWRWVHTLVTRYEKDGLDALEQSRKPKSNPRHISPTLTNRIIELRRELTATGLDAGPGSIRSYLNKEGGLLRGFRTAELVDSFMLPGLAVDNHSGLRWGVGNRALSAGVDCCRTPRSSG